MTRVTAGAWAGARSGYRPPTGVAGKVADTLSDILEPNEETGAGPSAGRPNAGHRRFGWARLESATSLDEAGRLGAFALILIAILDKNRTKKV